MSNWPQIPVYETPPEIENESVSEEEGDSDEEGEASLKLELDNGDDDEDEEFDDEEDEDESIDGVPGGESPAAKKKKKKKRSKRKKKKKAPGVEDEEALAMSAAEGVDGVNLPPKPPPSAAEVALAEAVSRASMDELPPPPPSSNTALASKKNTSPKKRGPVVQWRVPKIERYERAPTPAGLVLPSGLVTRADFMELSGSGGITLKQLNKLQGLLEPSDPSFAGEECDDEDGGVLGYNFEKQIRTSRQISDEALKGVISLL